MVTDKVTNKVKELPQQEQLTRVMYVPKASSASQRNSVIRITKGASSSNLDAPGHMHIYIYLPWSINWVRLKQVLLIFFSKWSLNVYNEKLKSEMRKIDILIEIHWDNKSIEP